jgi:general secretion pathway protein D
VCIRRRSHLRTVALLSAALLAACQETAPPLASGEPEGGSAVGATPLRPPGAAGGGDAGRPIALGNTASQASGPPVIEMGTGRFIGPVASQGQIVSGVSTTGPDVTLDFVNVDVRDVARSVLGNLLHVSYVVDPAVQGNVTLQTGQPIPRARVLPTLADALQVSGVALAQRDGIYQLVPIAEAARQATLGGTGGGYTTRMVTPQYVAAADLQKVLEPLVPPGTTLQADAGRNLLIVTGTEAGVNDILRDISTFDVDYLRGMSFALLPLRNAQARDVAGEVTMLLGGGRGSLSGMVSVSAIERLNAVLVTAMQPAYLDRVRSWVARLDRAGAGTDRQLYVYRVQNGRASNLATTLRRAMGLQSSADSGAGGPGGYGTRFGDDISGGTTGFASSYGSSSYGSSLGRAPPALLGALSGATPQGMLSGGAGLSQSVPSQGLQGQGGVAGQGGGQGESQGQGALTTTGTGEPGPDQNVMRITADETNNALVIAATADEYSRIARALQKLDITPLQVVIDATIAEVTLTNQLQYGLQYFIQSGSFRALLSNASAATNNTTTTAAATSSTATSTTSNGPLSVFQGFNFLPGLNIATTGANGAVILQALSQLTRVQVLSSPNLLVLNNQPARIQVGDQVPIATASSVSTIAANAPTVNSIEYRDTGVILNITPRVNASGLVLLDVAEEVSNAGNTTTSTITSPTIAQRRITSSIAVSDGQTIALGGLIQDSRTKGKNGVPFLQDLPILGFLFGTRTDNLTRTELIVLITPHVVRNDADAIAVTDELRRKLPMTVPVVMQRGN